MLGTLRLLRTHLTDTLTFFFLSLPWSLYSNFVFSIRLRLTALLKIANHSSPNHWYFCCCIYSFHYSYYFIIFQIIYLFVIFMYIYVYNTYICVCLFIFFRSPPRECKDQEDRDLCYLHRSILNIQNGDWHKAGIQYIFVEWVHYYHRIYRFNTIPNKIPASDLWILTNWS